MFFLSVQWQAWLRHTRNVAPTINDLVQEERRRALIQDKAKALDQEWTQVINITTKSLICF